MHGPYESIDDYESWVARAASTADPLFYAVLRDGRAVGVAAYLRIAPETGSIEVGHINFSPLLQRSPAATEAMYLMMRQAFELGYRRYEWKCDSLNAPSRAAAQRLGLSYEGIFRQAVVYKDRNRDSAWYAAIDKEWPALKAAFDQWLAAENFDDAGQQRCDCRSSPRQCWSRAADGHQCQVQSSKSKFKVQSSKFKVQSSKFKVQSEEQVRCRIQSAAFTISPFTVHRSPFVIGNFEL